MSQTIDRFAAHLAHSLNSETDRQVQVEPGRLYANLTATLAGPRYLNQLLYQPAYAWRMEPDEAASRYFDATLARRLWLSGRADRSVAHRLFESLVQRGVEPVWQAAELRRQADSGEAAVVQPLVPLAVRAVADRLQAVPADISPGNAAATIRMRLGPLQLGVGASGVGVPEEFSAWDAIKCAPQTLHALEPGEPFNRFCGRVIDALRTANRPVQELLGLNRGLCPFDWLDVLPVNQVRSLRRFLAAIPDGAADTPDAWAEAWSRAPVTGHADAAALWRSEIGQALRASASASPWVDIETVADETLEAPAEVLDRQSFADELRQFVTDGVIDWQEHDLLCALYDGAGLQEALTDTGLGRDRCVGGLSTEAYVMELNTRIQNWRRRMLET